ncbi:MAG: hypothetical protein ABJM06_05890 [Gilvibacter sp.]
MRPPICNYCNKSRRDDDVSCRLVSFALTPEEKAFNDRMIANRRVGHKKGLEWFCEQHLEIAQKYTHLTLREAMKAMRLELSNNEPTSSQ